MAAPEIVGELVEKFETHREAYHAAQYNEAQLRQEFLNPLFEALGWDVYNHQGYSETHKEVIHEDAIHVGGRTKAPDYCFRAGGGVRSFFVEAKKPAVDVHDAIEPAYQLRRYVWSAKLPLGILTDFEEFSVYDGRVKPAPTDTAATARLKSLRYTEYVDRWDELAELLSPEAIRRGSIEKLLSGKRVAKGTAEVDAAFLAEIESWRAELAQNLALRNPGLSQRDLNVAVQRTIDRIVFLRICEDRGIEPYGQLQALLNGTTVYARLGELFQRADDRYNSGLFYFTPEAGRRDPPDRLTLGLSIDDKTLKDILRDLYYPTSPYEFSVLPAEILGQVYEQFLGKVIRLTEGHRARVEEKPEVKKAGGVYYTPSYIVDYIVQHTLGKLLEGKSPKQAAAIKVLDPACGSGSFLLGAYQFLLDWYRDRYESDGPEKHAKGRDPKLFLDHKGCWRLTSGQRKRILLEHIHGVDIDSQAVEVTKLSLLLKVLEGESKESINGQLHFARERALPDLSGNIKCGNSLIGPDFYEGLQRSLFDEEEIYRINAFDWKTEFPDVFRRKNPGFDAVMGNPPYGVTAGETQVAYYRAHFECAGGCPDNYALFIEQASRLLRHAGRLGMIVQSAFVSAPSAARIRDVFTARCRPASFVTLPYDVFPAYVDTIIVVADRLARGEHLRDMPTAKCDLVVFPPRFRVSKLSDFERFTRTADAAKWFLKGSNEFLVTLSDKERAIVGRMRSTGTRFCDVADIQRGVTPFQTAARPRSKKYARAFKGQVRRYRLVEGPVRFIRYVEALKEYKPPRYFLGRRLLLRELISRQSRLQAVFVDQDFVTNKSMQSILLVDKQYSILYLLALLNSRLMSWFFLAVNSVARRDDFPKIVLRQSRELPFRPLRLNSRADRARHDRLVELVEAMLKLNERVGQMQPGHPRTVLERQIAATDRRIDQLVYELYGLSDKEIALVEEATG